MTTVLTTDKLKDFPTQYNNDIASIQNKLFFDENGANAIKYTGTATISGDIVVTGDIQGNLTGTLSATNVVLSGGSNVEQELQTIGALNIAILDQVREFERLAEVTRRTTPSGFLFEGISNGNDLSSFKGLNSTGTNDADTIRFSDSTSDKYIEALVHGYKIKLNTTNTKHVDFVLPEAPSTGTRQDMVVLEVWKEVVDKETGLFFPFGNTHYADSNPVDETNLSDVQGTVTGSEYFIDSTGIYSVRANSVTEKFLSNKDHNIGMLESGDYFQIRYRLRTLSDVDSSIGFDGMLKDTSGNYFAPQGQLQNAPASTSSDTQAVGVISKDHVGNDKGVFNGGLKTGSNTMNSITDLSFDGMTYTIPMFVVNRKNKDVYGMGNNNGTAFSNTWVVDFSDANMDRLEVHGVNGQTLVSIGSSVYKVLDSNSTSGKARLQYVSGVITAPNGNGSHEYNGNVETFLFESALVDDGRWISNKSYAINARPEGLFSDQVDRRDVLDLRHKVSIKGFDSDKLSEDMVDVVLSGDYRQEWGNKLDFDPDGNGLATVADSTFCNVQLQSIGLGSTVPDAHLNTDITKLLSCKNGLDIGLNGQRTRISDISGADTYSFAIVDQSQPDDLESENDVVVYNAIAHTINVDLTTLTSNVSGNAFNEKFVSGHTPSMYWGDGTEINGNWVANSDYDWTFTITSGDGGGKFGYSSVGATESIFGTMEIEQGEGSTFVSENLFSDEFVNGAELFMSGIETPVQSKVRPMGGQDKQNKTLVLTGIVGAHSVLTKGVSGSFDSDGASQPSIIKDGSTYKMWFTAHNGTNDTIAYATSVDGQSWDKSNGMVLDVGTGGAFDDAGVSHPCVIKDGSTYRMWYTGNDGATTTIGYATSTDGITWVKNGSSVMGVGTGGAFDDTNVSHPIVIKNGSTFELWYQGDNGSGQLTIGHATSPDAIVWTKQGQAYAHSSTSSDWNYNEVTAISVIKDGSLYRMLAVGANNATRMLLSTNGLGWGVVGNSDFLVPGPVGSIDEGGIDRHSGCMIKDGTSYKLWYGANNGTDISVGYGILALSQNDGSGTSLNGTYTNLNPQVNFGFKSSDTVVLHYETIAKQDKSYTQDNWTFDAEPYVLIHGAGTIQNDTNPIFHLFNKQDGLTDDVSMSKDVADSDMFTTLSLLGKLQSKNMALFNMSELGVPLKGVDATAVVTVDTSFELGYNVSFSASMNKVKLDRLNNIVWNSDDTSNTKKYAISALSSVVADDGVYAFFIGAGDSVQNDTILGAFTDGSYIDTIGRPLRK